MTNGGHTWAIVLAAGSGSRLRSLTTLEVGVAVPKQFCSLQGGPSLLHDALRRAESIVPREHICMIVAREHRRWWQEILTLLPDPNVVVQPHNCGTAIGILLPLLRITMRDPDARVVLLPSDHHVCDEAVLTRALRTAVAELETRRDALIILGITPEDPDPDLGYIVPGAQAHGIANVERFVEKPSTALARSLVAAGALWNAFIIAAHAQTLLRLFRTRIPQIVVEMSAAMERDAPGNEDAALQALYENLETLDFSEHVMQGAEPMLRVLRVEPCGWSDLGTPGRVAATLRRAPLRAPPKDPTSTPLTGVLNLAVQQAHSTAGR